MAREGGEGEETGACTFVFGNSLPKGLNKAFYIRIYTVHVYGYVLYMYKYLHIHIHIYMYMHLFIDMCTCIYF